MTPDLTARGTFSHTQSIREVMLFCKRERKGDMLRRNLIPLWTGILVLSGMFLMGQQSEWPCTCVDNDGDGYGSPACDMCTYPELDCDDDDPDVYPDAPEICDNLDNQCPGYQGYGEVDEPHESMACIPEGCFDMGDHFGEGYSAELPVHNVCISAFEMDVHEVTNAELAECVAEGGCTEHLATISYTRPTYYGDPAYDDFPVIGVDWNRAEEYCTWAGKRLPTEAEWEYAARGGLAGKRYPWGDSITCDHACYGRGDDRECWSYCHNGECDNDTHPVESYAPNGYGIYDMAGNVSEWVNDWAHPDYYSVSPPNDPPGPADGFPPGFEYRVWRGGSWYNEPLPYLRVANRMAFHGGWISYDIGLRCARGGAYGP